jgi:hypothetical protein
MEYGRKQGKLMIQSSPWILNYTSVNLIYNAIYCVPVFLKVYSLFNKYFF